MVALGVEALLLLVGCGGGFSEEDAKSAIAELPYKVQYRHVAVPAGADGALAGRLIDSTGERVDFALTIADQRNHVHVLGVPGAIGTGAYFEDRFYLATNEETESSRHHPHRQNRRFAMGRALEDALCEKAYGHTCPLAP
jgi:hypothetical protein